MTTYRPAISVIIPVFNTSEYLHACVSSVLQQTHQDFEIVLIDDGSTDGSADLCDQYAIQDPRVRVVHQENRGLPVARNVGMSHATADLLTFIDSDDWVNPTFLAVLQDMIVENSADMAMCATTVEDGAFRSESRNIARPIRILGGREVLQQTEVLYPIDTTSAWGKLMRRTLWSGLSFPEGRLHEDTYVVPRVIHRAQRVACTTQALYHYRQRPGSITWGNWSLRSRIDKARGLVERASFLNSIGVQDRAVKDYMRAFSFHVGVQVALRSASSRERDDLTAEINEQRAIFQELASSLPLSTKFRIAAWCYRISPSAVTTIAAVAPSQGDLRNDAPDP